MADIFSDDSRWFNFGTLPALPDWQLFSSGALGGKLFEVSFGLDWNAWDSGSDGKFKSYCLLNFYYRRNGVFDVSEQRSKKIYLKPGAQIIECPTPVEFASENSSVVTRVPGFRYQTFKKAAMYTPEAVFSWTLKLRYLVQQ
ncbi:hypothetical protein [Microcoleus sp. OTE_8_concoct_300]|uniref:hypothetical protein n=1 Tax=Microcoleus sp. OTE_8_concoct_300 TaxID=2964710 RepID=UPI00403F0CCD